MTMLTLIAQDTNFFGTIKQPEVLTPYGPSGGLITFISNALTFVTIIGGLLALGNLILAGFTYLTSTGDSKAHEKVLQKLNASLLGMLLIILAPAIMAIMGWVLFKDSTYFLVPKIKGPVQEVGPANRVQ